MPVLVTPMFTFPLDEDAALLPRTTALTGCLDLARIKRRGWPAQHDRQPGHHRRRRPSAAVWRLTAGLPGILAPS